jgi:hypothetical protein
MAGAVDDRDAKRFTPTDTRLAVALCAMQAFA